MNNLQIEDYLKNPGKEKGKKKPNETKPKNTTR